MSRSKNRTDRPTRTTPISLRAASLCNVRDPMVRRADACRNVSSSCVKRQPQPAHG